MLSEGEEINADGRALLKGRMCLPGHMTQRIPIGLSMGY